jgi:hypothetical protein
MLLALLAAALPFALRLERQLSALRRDHAALIDGSTGFENATREAKAALSGLRGTAEAQVQQAATVEALREDLRFLMDRGEVLADRLEVLVRQARPVAVPPVGAGPDKDDGARHSQAERDLLRALRLAR